MSQDVNTKTNIENIDTNKPQPSEDLLVMDFKQKIISLINSSPVSIIRKEEVLANIFNEINSLAKEELEKQLDKYNKEKEIYESKK